MEKEADLPWPESPDRQWWGPVPCCCETLEAPGTTGPAGNMLTALSGARAGPQSRCSASSEKEAPGGRRPRALRYCRVGACGWVKVGGSGPQPSKQAVPFLPGLSLPCPSWACPQLWRLVAAAETTGWMDGGLSELVPWTHGLALTLASQRSHLLSPCPPLEPP